MAMVLSGSTARGRRTRLSDVDYHVIGATSLRVTDLPADIDLYADDVDRFWAKLRKGDDFAHWSVSYGCELFDSGVIREGRVLRGRARRMARSQPQAPAGPQRVGLRGADRRKRRPTAAPGDKASEELGGDVVDVEGADRGLDTAGAIERDQRDPAGDLFDHGPPPERPEPDPTDPFWREALSLIWPADRAWFVASEVYFDSTVIGGSRSLVDALPYSPGLEVFEVTPQSKLTAFSDKLNPLPSAPADGRGHDELSGKR